MSALVASAKVDICQGDKRWELGHLSVCGVWCDSTAWRSATIHISNRVIFPRHVNSKSSAMLSNMVRRNIQLLQQQSTVGTI